MRRHLSWQILLLIWSAIGCASTYKLDFGKQRSSPREFEAYAGVAELEIDSPRELLPAGEEVGQDEFRDGQAPILLSRDWPPKFDHLTLQRAVRLALENSDVLRDMGGLVLRSPAAVRSVHDPAIRETDPRFGVEAALSAFDASFAASAFFQKNDRPLNNAVEGLGTNVFVNPFQQDLGLYNFELAKRTATGANLSLRHVIDYNFNNSPANAVPNLPWAARLEGEIRQPLLQGAGVEFNRIAGPNGIPGFSNGVLVARLNTDIALTEFEGGIRDVVNNVENAYWELYYAYRDLEAKIAARNRALETWEKIRRVRALGKLDAEQETQAEEQYYRLESDVQNAVSGRVLEKSNSNVFRGTGGVIFLERRLRRAMGIPVNQGALLFPTTSPPMAQVLFSWEDAVRESLARRMELRRQKWEILRLENELLAARNYLYPRLDAVARYRFRGLGHDLLDPRRNGRPPFDNAYQNLTTGDFQEWEMGVEYTVPLGFRQAHTAVRHAELRLARARAILREQQQEVIGDLTTAVAEADRAFQLAKINYNRRTAAYNHFLVVKNSHDEAVDLGEQLRLLTRLLEAQRRLADADSQFYRALSEYAFSLKQVHYEKGSLLDYNEIFLSEGAWSGKAHADAARRNADLRVSPVLTNKVRSQPPIVSNGPYPQEYLTPSTRPARADSQ